MSSEDGSGSSYENPYEITATDTSTSDEDDGDDDSEWETDTDGSASGDWADDADHPEFGDA